MKTEHDFRRIDNKAVPAINNEIRAFMVARNERLRLPAVLDHHRMLGIDRFFIVDNDSADGTAEFLLEQPDVHVFQTRDSFSSSQCGYAWTNTLLEVFGTGGWCLTIDADEQFIYPDYENVNIHALCDILDRSGSRGLFTIFLDMYSDRPIRDTSYRPGDVLMDICPFFDAASYRCVNTENFPSLQVYGGVRERVFWNGSDGGHPPTLSQVPLVRWQRGTRYLLCRHAMTPVPIAPITGVLLHYKFLFDFHERAKRVAGRGEHFAGGREYKEYARVLDREGSLCLKTDQSFRFTGSAQLGEMGLMSRSLSVGPGIGAPHQIRSE